MSQILYDPLKINVTITFTQNVFIKNIIYQAWTFGYDIVGYPEELNIYCSLEPGRNANLTLVDTIISNATKEKVVFILSERIECIQLNLEWKKIHNITSYSGVGAATEIIFLDPDMPIYKTSVNDTNKTDYSQLNFSENYENINNPKQLTEDLNKYKNKDYRKGRNYDIMNGKLKYTPKKRFLQKKE